MKVTITILSVVLMISLSACSSSGSSSGKSISTNQSSQPDKTSKTTHNTSSNTNNSSTTKKSSTKKQSSTSSNRNATSNKNPKNIRDVNGFVPDKKQSFLVNLKKWGNVKFVSGKITSGDHIPTVFYLTNRNGDILYNFYDSPFPYDVEVKAVSFQDVNKDGLKDIIIIVSDHDNSGKPIAAVWLQNANKTFTCDLKLLKELNHSGNNTDIKTVTAYLSKRF